VGRSSNFDGNSRPVVHHRQQDHHLFVVFGAIVGNRATGFEDQPRQRLGGRVDQVGVRRILESAGLEFTAENGGRE